LSFFIGAGINAAEVEKFPVEAFKAVPYSESQVVKLLDRDILTSAEVIEEGKGEFRAKAAMMVRATPERARKILTNFGLFKEWLPLFVKRSDYDAKKKWLDLEGGVLNLVLKSGIRFKEVSPELTTFKVETGSFQGLEGEVHFWKIPVHPQIREGGSLVWFDVKHRGKLEVSSWLLKRAAEAVFDFTAPKMRAYTEDQDFEPDLVKDSKTDKNDQRKPEPTDLPKPVRRLDL
jgi:hypothetical protein